MTDKVSTWLWCDGTAEEQAEFYTRLIPNSRIVRTVTAAAKNPSNETGDVMTVEFELDGRSFFALNGGPHFSFSEAISLQIDCADQAEVDQGEGRARARPPGGAGDRGDAADEEARHLSARGGGGRPVKAASRMGRSGCGIRPLC